MAVEVSPVVAEFSVVEYTRLRRDLERYVSALRRVVAETTVKPSPYALGEFASLDTLRWVADDLDRVCRDLSPAALTLLRATRESSPPAPEKCAECGHLKGRHNARGACRSCVGRTASPCGSLRRARYS